MNIIDLENERIKLIQNLNENVNYRIKLFLIANYFNSILASKNKEIIEAFTTEFIEIFSSLLQNITPQYLPPEKFKKIIEQTKTLQNFILFDELKIKLENSLNIFELKFAQFEKILNGEILDNQENKIKFPVLEKFEKEKILLGGFIESISVSIKVTYHQNKFIVVPSNSNLEKRLSDQINISWKCAVKYLQSFIKLKSKFYEVVIQFDQKYGNYIGDSFGTALTTLFIQNLLDLSNAGYLIKIKPGIVLTGGINEKNEILSVSDEIIEKKTELVFFSEEQIFVIPKADEFASLKKVKELQTEFPKRKLSIIAIENLEDLFNRRNIIEIKKLSLVKKSTRKLKRNWKAAIIILPLLIILAFFFYRDFDDNPAILESSENSVFVKNKSGKVLWARKIGYDPTKVKSQTYLKYYQKLVDINNDGINEVILANEDFSEIKNENNFLRIVCFDKNENEIWQNNFRDTITANLQKMDTIYSSLLIDTTTIKNMKIIVCYAQNVKSFSSAIYQLDLKTGKRINNTLWNAGFFTNGYIYDFNADGKNELSASFLNNGFEQVGFLLIELDNLNGQCPTTSKYRYKNLNMANLEQYILFPKTDYSHYINQRMGGFAIGGSLLHPNENKILIYVEMDYKQSCVHYYYNYLKNDFEIIIGNEFRVTRDSLVVHGKLKPPLTDTDEYCNLLNSQIKYWNGKEFVYKKDLTK